MKKDFLKQNLKSIAIGMLFIITSIFLSTQKQENNNEKISVEEKQLDTFIPKNHSLIPIEIKNSETLDSIFGNYGKVNLYLEKSGKNILIVKNIKLLRAPKNPSHFAVLVSDEKASLITKYDKPFFVSLSSNSNSGTVFVTEETKRKVSNVYIGVENE
jgi:hypothetical protein